MTNNKSKLKGMNIKQIIVEELNTDCRCCEKTCSCEYGCEHQHEESQLEFSCDECGNDETVDTCCGLELCDICIYNHECN